jgi:hypothetical protein
MNQEMCGWLIQWFLIINYWLWNDYLKQLTWKWKCITFYFFSHNINIHFQAISFLVSNFSQNSEKNTNKWCFLRFHFGYFLRKNKSITFIRNIDGCLEKIYNLDSCCLLMLSFGDDNKLYYNKKLIKKKHSYSSILVILFFSLLTFMS